MLTISVRLYGQTHGRAAIPFPRYVTDADSALIKTVAHEVTYGTTRADAFSSRQAAGESRRVYTT